MKRLIAGFVIIIILGGACYLGVCATQKAYEEIYETIENSEKYMQNGEEAQAKSAALKAEELWIEKEKLLAIFINHELLDEVGLKLSQLEPFANENTKEEFFASVNSAKTALTHMRSGQIPSVETVM
ncbi:MAG: DUF4363 family protein [Clostridia bacterium]|nr:DUF4363 family protein [Clostridia bacterium]